MGMGNGCGYVGGVRFGRAGELVMQAGWAVVVSNWFSVFFWGGIGGTGPLG